MLLDKYRHMALLECSLGQLFGRRPTLPFRSNRRRCPDCHKRLYVRKTRTRRMRTLSMGAFTAHETLLECRNNDCSNQRVYADEAPGKLVAPGSCFGYDVLVYVGRALFLRHRCIEEIIEELAGCGVAISASEVAYLAKRFVASLALAHREATPRIKKAMKANGGCILHLDGTHEKSAPVLMSSLDSLSGILLGNVKVPTEKTEELVAFLKQIKQRYGSPVACVHDMAPGILAAVEEVFPGVPDFICHFHFLRDAGKDLLEKEYAAIRQRLRKHGLGEKLQAQARTLKPRIEQHPDLCPHFCQSLHRGDLPIKEELLERFPLSCAYSLIHWTLAGKHQVDGYGFPFDRPHVEFAKRLLAVHTLLGRIQRAPLKGKRRMNRPLCKLAQLLQPLAKDRTLKELLHSIEEKARVFDRLRKAMRMVPAGGNAGLNSGDEPAAMGPIQKAVTAFRQNLARRPHCQPGSPWQKLIDQIDKYQEKLFADAIEVKVAGKPVRVQPQRTNNVMERLFRDFRRGSRRKSGHNSISKLLQAMLAETPLVKNLDIPDYLKILLNGHPDLESCFAHLEVAAVRAELNSAKNGKGKIPAEIKMIIDDPAFPDLIDTLFANVA